MVYHWLDFVRERLFPTYCRLCRAPGLPGLELCADCREELPWLPRGCRGCAIPLPDDAQATYCPSCQISPGALDSCVALFAYEEPVDRWIQGAKFNNELAAARLLGDLLADAIPSRTATDTASLVPVPLHRKRLAERGYNQSVEIARRPARLGYRLELDYVRRSRHTPAQTGLSARQRKSNLRGAFSVRRNPRGRHIILIDDVLTTGSTLNELAQTLKDAGAARVDAWVIGRTLSGPHLR
jgi:ComF family protein